MEGEHTFQYLSITFTKMQGPKAKKPENTVPYSLPKVIVWGHSLGTAISSHLVADLCQEDQRPCALVLESPFNNIFDEVRQCS